MDKAMKQVSEMFKKERDKKFKKQKTRRTKLLKDLKKVMSQLEKEMGNMIFKPHIFKRMKNYKPEEIKEAIIYLRWNNEIFELNERIWRV